MPPPSTVVCELCGGKFSKHSLVIHQKQCMVKRELSTAFCPCCDQLVSNDEYSKHVTQCRVVNERTMRAKKDAADKAKAAVAKAGGTAAAMAAGGDAARAVALVAASASAAAAGPAAAASGPRSKIPDAVLRRLEAAKNGVSEETPEQKLVKRCGGPCDACPGSRSTIVCVGCHMVYCKTCSANIHEGNDALAAHTPETKGAMLDAEGAAQEKAAAEHRVACAICDRKFEATRVAKHQLVCASQSTKKIKVKYATDLRVKGTDFEKFLKKVRKNYTYWSKQQEQQLCFSFLTLRPSLLSPPSSFPLYSKKELHQLQKLLLLQPLLQLLHHHQQRRLGGAKNKRHFKFKLLLQQQQHHR